MLVDTNKNRGRAGLSLAIAYYGANGYSVNIPLNDTQWYDLLLEKNGEFYTVQCKCTTSQTKTIELKSRGGTKGSVYDNILDHPLDFLFCLDGISGIMYSIPFKDLQKAGNTKSISLRTEPTTNNQGFQTYKYIVSI